MSFDLTVKNDNESFFFLEDGPDEFRPDDTLAEFDVTSIENETAPDEPSADEESFFQPDE